MGYGPMIRGHQTALKKQPFQAPGSVDILDPLDQKKGKNRGHSQIQFPTKTRFSMLASSSLLYIYYIILYINIIFYSHHYYIYITYYHLSCN